MFPTQNGPPARRARTRSKNAPVLAVAFCTGLLISAGPSSTAGHESPDGGVTASADLPFLSGREQEAGRGAQEAGRRAQEARLGEQEARRGQQEELLREIAALEDSLGAAQKNLALGREQMNFLRRQLLRLTQEIEAIQDEPGYEVIRDRLLKLESGLMESEYWRRYFPEMEGPRETRVRNEIFMVGRDVEVGVFEKVRGNVVVIGGKVTVSGSVGGDVIAVGDDIHVTRTGRVGGDAWTLGGHIIQEPGGMVEGDWIDTSSFLPAQFFLFRHNPLTWLALAITGIVFILVASLLTGLVAPRNVDRIETHLRGRFGTSFLVGLVTEIALPFVIILLLITIIGIPVALILVPVMVAGLLLLGFTGVAKSVGRGASRRGLKLGESSLALITIGVLVLESLYILSRALGFAPGMLTPIAFAGRIMGGLVLYVAWTTGLGAAIMTRFGTRMPGEEGGPALPKPAPPPVGGEPAAEAPTA